MSNVFDNRPEGVSIAEAQQLRIDLLEQIQAEAGKLSQGGMIETGKDTAAWHRGELHLVCVVWIFDETGSDVAFSAHGTARLPLAEDAAAGTEWELTWGVTRTGSKKLAR